MVKQDGDVQNKGCVLACMWVGQKVSAQDTCFVVCILNSNKNSSDTSVLLLHYFSKYPPLKLRHISYNRLLMLQVDVLCYQPSCHNCFYCMIISKFMAADIFLEQWNDNH